MRVGFLRHPKTRRLRRRLGADGVLGLVALWDFCRESRPDGCLVGLDADDIEDTAEWHGPSGELVDVLVEIGFLDGEPGAWSVHNWQLHQEHATQQCARNATASANAHARWHRAGKHEDQPKPGCPLCEQTPGPQVAEITDPVAAVVEECTRSAPHDAPQSGRNAPTNQPTYQPTNQALHVPPAQTRTKRKAAPMAYRVEGQEVGWASLEQCVLSWPGWSTRRWSAWSDRARSVAEQHPITLDELEEVRRQVETLKRQEGKGLPPNVGLLVARLENRRRAGRVRAKPRQIPLIPDSEPGWQQCGAAAKALFAQILGEQPRGAPA